MAPNADPDRAAVLGRTEKAGGQKRPQDPDLPEYGFMAVFIDCEGNRRTAPRARERPRRWRCTAATDRLAEVLAAALRPYGEA